MDKDIKAKAKIPTKEELKRIDAVIAASRHPLRDNLLFALSFECGPRVHEIAALKLYHCFNEDWTVKKSCTLPKTKGNKKRELYFSHPLVKQALKAYLQFRKKLAAKQKRELRLQEALIVSQKGSHFSGDTLQKRFERIYKDAGIEGASSHSGRRFFASKLNHLGVDIRSIQVLMGHENIATTAEYIDTDPDKLSKIVEKMPLWNK